MGCERITAGTQRAQRAQSFLVLALLLVTPSVLLAQSNPPPLGRTPSAAELGAIDIDVSPDGRGLPRGESTALAGRAVYERHCRSCHGATGTEGPNDLLAGGRGSLTTPRPLKTVGSYWPYATTLWDYINRAMPFAAPRTLSNDEVYGVTAYVLFLNGIVTERQAVSQATLPAIQMPNRSGFTSDTRPHANLQR